MKEIANSVFEAAKGAAISQIDAAPVKAVVAGAFALATGNHGTALLAFVVLIGIDLLAKFLALSAKRLNDMGLPTGLWRCFVGIWAAYKTDYIKSELMKTKFAGKLVLYMILVTTAFHVDAMVGGNELFLKATWYYLAGTEFLSIGENLRDAGVKSLDPLLNFVRSKLGGMK